MSFIYIDENYRYDNGKAHCIDVLRALITRYRKDVQNSTDEFANAEAVEKVVTDTFKQAFPALSKRQVTSDIRQKHREFRAALVW